MRLFAALWPPPETVMALVAAAPAAAVEGWVRPDPSTWHITLAYYGEARIGPMARQLEAATFGARAPRLRLRGSGAFETVRWAGVQSEPETALAELAQLAALDQARRTHGAFVAHVTVLRRRARPGGRVDPDPATPWSAHVGPWWRPGELLLVASEPARGGVRYRPVHRVPLGLATG